MSEISQWIERFEKMAREIEAEKEKLNLHLPQLSEEIKALERQISQKEQLIQDWQNLRPQIEKILGKLGRNTFPTTEVKTKAKMGVLTSVAPQTRSLVEIFSQISGKSREEIASFLWREGNKAILDMSSDTWKHFPHKDQIKLAKQYQEAYAKLIGKNLVFSPKIYQKTILGSEKHLADFELVLIPPGRYNIGGSEHKITLREGFYIGKYPVTQDQWQAVTGKNPSKFKSSGEKAPLETVSWNEAQNFFQRKEILSAGLRFPSEAEWEYSCRGGCTGEYGFGDNKSELEKYAWYEDNSKKKTNPVGEKTPNAYEIYDMHGNVWEWCEDIYKHGYEHICKDGSAYIDNEGSSDRVIRGGSWFNSADSCSASFRYRWRPGNRNTSVGFRVARSLSTTD